MEKKQQQAKEQTGALHGKYNIPNYGEEQSIDNQPLEFNMPVEGTPLFIRKINNEQEIYVLTIKNYVLKQANNVIDIMQYYEENKFNLILTCVSILFGETEKVGE